MEILKDILLFILTGLFAAVAAGEAIFSKKKRTKTHGMMADFLKP